MLKQRPFWMPSLFTIKFELNCSISLNSSEKGVPIYQEMPKSQNIRAKAHFSFLRLIFQADKAKKIFLNIHQPNWNQSTNHLRWMLFRWLFFLLIDLKFF